MSLVAYTILNKMEVTFDLAAILDSAAILDLGNGVNQVISYFSEFLQT